jgi:ATP-dependent DNA helicase RecQ
MGVDKKNIRSVIHREPSPSVEAYLQESGRAGRDGTRSHAVILLSPEDRRHIDSIDRPGERARYGELLRAIGDPTRCRRAALLSLLDAELENCFGCDVCVSLAQSCAHGERELLRFFAERPYRFDKANAARILSGRLSERGVKSGHLSEKHFAVLIRWRREEVEEAIESLVESGHLKKIRRGPWKGCVGPGAAFLAASGLFSRLSPRLRRIRDR